MQAYRFCLKHTSFAPDKKTMSCWPQIPNQFFLYFVFCEGPSVVHRPALQKPAGQSLSIPQAPALLFSRSQSGASGGHLPRPASSTGFAGAFLARGASGGGAGAEATSGALASLLACSAAAANAIFVSGVTSSFGNSMTGSKRSASRKCALPSSAFLHPT